MSVKFDPVEIPLMSVVPALVYEYCRQLVPEQSQDAKCCGAPGCSIARRVTRSSQMLSQSLRCDGLGARVCSTGEGCSSA